MRNLKRALSLALATVMTLGLMVVGTGAVGYDDVTSEDNQEAIEVLQTVGVMSGVAEDNFDPDGVVTRNQMAVIMCQLLDYTVSTYKGTTSFTDVASWALPYVEACYTNGIIAGYSDTQFGGEDPVTTGQAGLMILKALSYFQEQGDFGQDWLVETVRQGSQIQLFEGVDNGAREPLTRNDVAQMILNALQAECVEITSHDLVSDGNGGFTTKAVYTARTAPTSSIKYAAVDDTRATNGDQIINLGEDLFDGDLKKDQSGDVSDDFGRPSTEWTYKLEKIGTYPDEPIAVYTAGVNKMDLYDLLGRTVVNDIISDENSMVVYNDGIDGTHKTVVSDAEGAGEGDSRTNNSNEIANYVARNSKVKATGTGNGVLTEVYMDADGNVTIVEINTYLVEAAGDYNDVKEELRVNFYSDVDTTILNAGANVLSAEDFDNLEGIQDGDFLLITVADGDIKSVEPAETLTGTVDEYAQNHASVDGKEITIDGNPYKYSAKAGGQADEDYAVGEQASVVLDKYGYIIGVAEAMVASNFAYVMDATKVSGLRGGSVEAVLAFADGTTEPVTINKVDSDNASSMTSTDVDNTLDEQWFAYSRTSNGMINLMTLNTGYTSVGNAYQLTDSTDENKTIFNGETIVAYNTAYNSNAVATAIAADPTLTAKLNNAKTVLLVIDGDDEVTVYNGTGNLPVILSSTLDDDRRIIVRGLVKNSSSAYVAYMAVDLGAMETDEYEIIDTSATPDYMFLLDEVSEIHAANGEIYYTYETLMSDGTVEKVTFDATSAANQYNLIYKAHYNKDDYVTSSTAVSNTTPYFNNVYTGANAFAGLSYADGAMQIIDQDGSDSENFIVTDDTKIVLIADGDTGLCRYDGVSYEVNEVKASYLDSVLDGYVFAGRIAGKTVEANSNVLETMYIFVDQLWDNTNNVAVGTNDCGFGI